MDMERYCQGEPLTVGTEPVLLLDAATVEDRWGVRRVLNQPFKEPRNPVLMPDMPWEDTIGQPSVIFDPEINRWRMWYTACDWHAYVQQFNKKDWKPERDGYPYFMCYAESNDGVHWERPMLEGHPYKEHARTNVIHHGEQKCSGARVQWNHPSTGQPGRFLLTYKDNRPQGKGSFCLAYSDDGINWREDPGNPVYTWLRDTWHNMVFDPARERWLMFTRPKVFSGVTDVPGGPTEHNFKRRMAIIVGETPRDFKWPRVVLWPEENDDPDFDNFIGYRVGSHFICFVASMSAPPFMEFNAHLAFSGDGLHWNMMPNREVYLPHGGPHEWDCGSVSGIGALVASGNKNYIYYRGSRHGQSQSNRNNQTGIGRAEFLRDRFAAQMGAHTGGFLLTREMLVGGPALYVNITVADGYNSDPATAAVPPEFACEVLHFTEGNWAPVPVPGYELAKCATTARDLVEHRVVWEEKKDLADLVGKPVFIRFYLKNCGLYSLRFGEDDA